MSMKVLDKQKIYTGKKVTLELHHLENEETGKKHKQEIVVHPGAVVILPIRADGGIVLIRNRRYAVGQTLLELPAGTLEPREDPMNCAGRELAEETGLLAGRLKFMTSFYSSPGIMTERMYAFIAYDLQSSVMKLEDGEEIELYPCTLDQALDMCGNGQIADGKTMVTLLMYDRFHRAGDNSR